MTRTVFVFVASATLLLFSLALDGTETVRPFTASDLAIPVHAAAMDSSSDIPADVGLESSRRWTPSLSEPSTLLMMGGAFLGFAALSARRSSAQSRRERS